MQKISREIALFFLKYDLIDTQKALIVCKDFANDDGDFVEVISEDYDSINDDKDYKEFEIWLRQSKL